MQFIGKIIYLISFPFILLIIRNSKRVYAAIIFEDKILVTKNFLGLHNAWRLPGGGLKKGESELNGLVREVQEEVGIRLSVSQLSVVISNKRHKKNFNYSVYVCNLKKQPNIKIDNKEILEAQFMPIKTLKTGLSASESLVATVNFLMND